MGIFTSSNIISENGITGTTIDVTTINAININSENSITGTSINATSISSENGITGVTIDSTSINTTTINATTVDATTISGDTFYGDGSGLINVPSDTLYTINGLVGTSRVVSITDTLTWSGGSEIREVNGRFYKEITKASDLPTTLVADTSYIFRGEVTITSNITCNVDGVELVGSNREEDGVIWAGTGAFLTLTDCNFDIEKMKFSSTVSGNSILVANNVAASGYNFNRLKVLALVNCQFRGCYDVMDVNGYDLVDINNTLFFYIKATNFGLRFRDTSKLEISSCEIIRWFDESTIPTPSGWATVSMVELQNNNLASFGAVNINGCIIHPQQTQNGIDIGTGSTTGFGTISSNAYVKNGLTTGKVFLPQNLASLPDYSQTATYNYDIFANQGLLNSTSGIMMTVTDNTNDTDLTDGVPSKVETDGLALNRASVRFDLNTDGRVTYVGTKQVYVSVHVTIGYDKQGGGTDNFVFYIYKNGAQLPGSQTKLRVGGNEGGLGMVYGTLMEQNDYLELWVEVVGSDDDMLIQDLQFLVRE